MAPRALPAQQAPRASEEPLRQVSRELPEPKEPLASAARPAAFRPHRKARRRMNQQFRRMV